MFSSPEIMDYISPLVASSVQIIPSDLSYDGHHALDTGRLVLRVGQADVKENRS